MHDDVREALRARSGPVQWRDLQAHVLREAVFLVASHLDPIEVAVAVAGDDVAQVERWIREGALARPGVAQLSTWEHTPDKAFFAVPVQPHVLAQEILEPG